MKTILRMGLLLGLFISLHIPIQAYDVKEVYTVDDWLAIEVGDHVLLMNDLDFEGINYIPIPHFSGSIDGQGYILSNVSINLLEDSSILNAGLFGQLSGASIRNLNIDRMFIGAVSETVSVGSIAGRALNSTFENIMITNTKLNSGFNAGGLIGTIEPLVPWADVLESNVVMINQTSFNGSIKGAFQVGGLVGSINKSTSVSVRNSFTKGTLDAFDSIGPIIGEILSSSVDIKDVYSKMTLINTSNEISLGNFAWIGKRMGDGSETHQLVIEHAYHQTRVNDPSLYQYLKAWVGSESDSPETLLNDVYYNRDTLLLDDVGMKTSEELLIKETYASFDFNTIWLMDASLNDGLPLFQYEVFKVTLYPNNGDDNQTLNQLKNTNISIPEFVFDGYTLDAWYLDETWTVPFDSTLHYKQDTNLYAKWIEDPIDELIIEEQDNQEPSPVYSLPVPELKAPNEIVQVVRINKPAEVIQNTEDSSELKAEPSTIEEVTESNDKEKLNTPVQASDIDSTQKSTWCWLWWLWLVLLIAYLVYRYTKKRKLEDKV